MQPAEQRVSPPAYRYTGTLLVSTGHWAVLAPDDDLRAPPG